MGEEIKTKEELIERINKFLEKRIENEGGEWTNVSKEDVEELWFIIMCLLDLKFERDCDGDHTIEISIVNRKNVEKSHYISIPYFKDEGSTMQDILNHVFKLSTNVRIATDRFDEFMRYLTIKFG